MEDPTKHGLAIRPDQPIQYRDIFDYVYQQWLAEYGATPTWPVESFISKARELFTKNQPIAQDFMGPSLSLRFQDGLILPVCDTANSDIIGGEAGAAQVAKPHPPNREGKGRTMPTPSWGVTGPE